MRSGPWCYARPSNATWRNACRINWEIDRPAFLTALEFRVVGNRDGRNIIEVTSQQSIAEPFVTLLVEATWPRGRTLR